MAKKEEKRIFNLLKPIEIPKTAWDKVYDWLLGKAKIVLLITQIVVAISFFAKVVVDTMAKNKDKKIEKLQSELNFYALETEPLLRQIHNKDNDYKKLWNAASNYSPVLNEIYSYIANPVAEMTIRIDDGKVSIFGNDDISVLGQIEESLKNSESFTEARVSDISQEQRDIIEGVGRYVIQATISPENIKRKQL